MASNEIEAKGPISIHFVGETGVGKLLNYILHLVLIILCLYQSNNNMISTELVLSIDVLITNSTHNIYQQHMII